MIITSKSGTEFDLTEKKRVSSLRTQLTKAHDNHNLPALEHVKKQLDQYQRDKKSQYNADSVAQDIHQTVEKAIEGINKLAIINIKTKQSSYNVTLPDERKKLEGRIKAYGKSRDLKTLESIKEQIAKEKKKNPAFMSILEYLEKMVIERMDIDLEYQSYTEVLSENFLKGRRVINKSLMQQENIYRYDEEALQDYLKKSVTKKKKTGEENFQELSACFWLDFSAKTDFLAQANEEQKAYFVIAFSRLFSHNSTYYPAQGYGKSQQKECEAPLVYYRSQSEHPIVQQYMVSALSNSYGPQNEVFKQMVQDSSIIRNKEYAENLQALNEQGVLTEAVKLSYFGATLAHLATRSNETELLRGLISDFSEKNIAIFLPKKPNLFSDKYSSTVLSGNLTAIKTEFHKLSAGVSNWEPYSNLQSEVSLQRNNQARKIVEACVGKSLDMLNVTHPENSSFIYIDLFPSFDDEELKQSKNYKEGLTNLLIGFLGGLINANAKAHGLHEFVQRRQSFGFLRASITDAGSLRVRLSLGLESEAFNKVVIDSIEEFNRLLKQYNFISPNESTSTSTKKLVKKSKEACERKQGKEETDKTGNYWLNSMRCVDDQWVALLISEKYITQAHESDDKQDGSQRDKRKKLSQLKINMAFEKYLQEFIINRVKHKKVAENDSKDIRRVGYSFVNESNVVLEEAEGQNETIIEKSQLLQILKNIVQETINLVTMLDKLPTSYSLYYLLLKLLHNCQKGMALIEHSHEYELSHIHSKANLLIENLQEYLIPFKVMINDIVATKDLTEFEKKKVASALAIDESVDIGIFYNDSGMQAINASILSMLQQNFLEDEDENSLYLFPGSYYEIHEFCKDAGINVQERKNASTWFCDITQIDFLQEKLSKAKQLRTVVIDVTNNSSVDALEGMQETVANLRKKGIWVVLTCSSLKHEELGLDKYQSGKSVYIAPEGQTLKTEIAEKLQKISNQVMNPLTASLRQTVEIVTNEYPKSDMLRKSTEGSLLAKAGLFKQAVQINEATPGQNLSIVNAS